jgi:lipid II:glycine glycyltransferase (peptidoglycan interpeptide bridge formation enzyme)
MKKLQSHFLQTRAWKSFQADLGREVLEETTDSWHALAIVEQGQLARRLYCPYGPSVTKKTDLKPALQWLKEQADERGLDFVRIEPLISNSVALEASYLQSLGLVKSQKHVQPHYTIRVDLRKSADAVLAAMSQTTRNLYRNIHKKGVVYSESNNPLDMKELIKMLTVVSKRTGMTPHSDEYLQTEATVLLAKNAAKLFVASVDNKPVAMALIYCSPEGWYYSHAASYESARKLNVMQPLVAHIILSAKKAGAPMFDLYGIAPPYASPNHPLVPITEFKKSFGGEEITFSGTWELPIRTLRYRVYRLLRRITKN